MLRPRENRDLHLISSQIHGETGRDVDLGDDVFGNGNVSDDGH
jgi:hypothetical protein